MAKSEGTKKSLIKASTAPRVPVDMTNLWTSFIKFITFHRIPESTAGKTVPGTCVVEEWSVNHVLGFRLYPLLSPILRQKRMISQIYTGRFLVVERLRRLFQAKVETELGLQYDEQLKVIIVFVPSAVMLVSCFAPADEKLVYWNKSNRVADEDDLEDQIYNEDRITRATVYADSLILKSSIVMLLVNFTQANAGASSELMITHKPFERKD
ncbi:hypothetical protein K435DRAFT_929493 [Dendrothele bispora CBS 962.96]|uniref:Uncharacterized protein n=1 Tax=Dendrothele bispora (strain CBS 962.96) TaxID=1314807 RepID=A0A4S8MV59_DENBC|nr:hypothetical protein K435DRAFT_929493 [Dendrothele bispora CBS 962.96]